MGVRVPHEWIGLGGRSCFNASSKMRQCLAVCPLNGQVIPVMAGFQRNVYRLRRAGGQFFKYVESSVTVANNGHALRRRRRVVEV